MNHTRCRRDAQHGALAYAAAAEHPEDRDEDGRADDGDDELPQPSAGRDHVNRIEDGVQHKRADDAEDDVHQKAHVAAHHLLGDPAGQTADDDRPYPTYAFHRCLLFLDDRTNPGRAARLYVDDPPVRVKNALVHRFRQGRMRKYAVNQLFLGRLQVHGDDKALDELRHFGADQMGPEKLAGHVVEYRLDQPLRLAQRDCLAIADEGKSTDLHLKPGL